MHTLLGDAFPKLWRPPKRPRRTRTHSPTLARRSADLETPTPNSLKMDEYFSDTNLAGQAISEEDMADLEASIARLLEKLTEHDADESLRAVDQECVVCLQNRASMQSLPCGHAVLCQRCLVRSIQIAVHDRSLPLRCSVCRCAILRLRHHAAPARPIRLCRRAPIPGTFSTAPLWTTTPFSHPTPPRG